MSDPNAPQGEQPNEGSTPVPPPPSWGAPGQQPGGQTPPPASPYEPPAQTPPPASPYGQPTTPPPASPYGQPTTPPASPYSAPPPPSSAYPPPPADGGFPPAPGAPVGGYGDPGYGNQGFVQPADVGSAYSWAFNKFGKNAGSAIVAMLLWGLAIAVLAIISILLIVPVFAASDASYSTSGGLSAAASLSGIGAVVFYILLYFVSFLSQLAMINGYLAVADGRQASIGDFFQFRNVGAGLIVALLTAVAQGLMQFIPILGWVLGIAISFFTIYALYFVVGGGQDGITALRSSINLSLKNAGQTILLAIAVMLTVMVGIMLCGVGALFAAPIAGLVQVYMYRRLTGQAVAPAI